MLYRWPKSPKTKNQQGDFGQPKKAYQVFDAGWKLNVNTQYLKTFCDDSCEIFDTARKFQIKSSQTPFNGTKV